MTPRASPTKLGTALEHDTSAIGCDIVTVRMLTRGGMHQTTIRFSAEVWARLEDVARDGGVSAAQFVRETVVARLANPAAQVAPTLDPAARAHAPADPPPDGGGPRPAAARAASMTVRADSDAVWAQARLARARAQEVREAARSVQGAARTQRRTSAWKPATSSHS